MCHTIVSLRSLGVVHYVWRKSGFGAGLKKAKKDDLALDTLGRVCESARVIARISNDQMSEMKWNTEGKKMKNLLFKMRVVAISCGVGLWMIQLSTATATTITVGPKVFPTTGNTVMKIDPDTGVGLWSWLITSLPPANQEQLTGSNAQPGQNYWLSLNGSVQKAFGSATFPYLPGPSTSSTTSWDFYYGYAADPNVFVEWKTSVNPGGASSHNSSLQETVTVYDFNTSGPNATMNIRLFEYTNINLDNQPNGQTVVFNTLVSTSSSVNQLLTGVLQNSDNVNILTGSLRYQGGTFGDLLPILNGGSLANLSNTPAIGVPISPADAVWAYQWDAVATGDVNGGSTPFFQIQKQIADAPTVAVPEPSTMGLVGVGFGVLLIVALRRYGFLGIPEKS